MGLFQSKPLQKPYLSPENSHHNNQSPIFDSWKLGELKEQERLKQEAEKEAKINDELEYIIKDLKKSYLIYGNKCVKYHLDGRDHYNLKALGKLQKMDNRISIQEYSDDIEYTTFEVCLNKN